jgi:hypothetical protein
MFTFFQEKQIGMKELKAFNEKIKEHEDLIEDLKEKRLAWARENRNEIKKLFPKKGSMSKIKNINSVISENLFREYNINTNEPYYFKVVNTIFDPGRNREFYNDGQLTVSGVILDVNLNQVEHFLDRRLDINNLEPVVDSRYIKKSQTKSTKVYVMIDKNTGYYKIGRSVKPIIREKTLQSEKPTIEMLFNHEAIVRDEKVLHDKFKNKRIRGEWFDLTGSDLQYIKEYFKPSHI